MPREYEKSPRQRLEWFGSRAEFELTTETTDFAVAEGGILLSHPARLALSTGAVTPPVFPAGIVRGETCSIARLIGHVSVYDIDRRQQNISYEVAAGLIRTRLEDQYIADPTSLGQDVVLPDPLGDKRASWIWHNESVWNPQSAGANYTVFSWDADIDTKNSRIFESNDAMQFSVDIRTRVNSGAATAVTARCVLLWRCLLRLD